MTTAIAIRIDPSRVDALHREHRACEQAYAHALDHALKCGQILLAIKEECAHGEWLPWLEQHVEFSTRRAQEYMQLASYEHEIINTRDSAHLSVDAALEQIKKPRKQPSTTEVGEMLQDLDTRTPEERLAVARERLRQDSAGEWTDQQRRKHARAAEMLEDIKAQLVAATEPGLAPLAIAREFRAASVKAHHLVTALDELAFTFDR